MDVIDKLVHDIDATNDISMFMELMRKLYKLKAERAGVDDKVLVRSYLRLPAKLPKTPIRNVKLPVPTTLIENMINSMEFASYSLGDLKSGKEMKRALATFSSFIFLVYEPKNAHQKFTEYGPAITCDYDVRLMNDEQKKQSLRTLAEVAFGLFARGWLGALEGLSEAQRLEYSRATISRDSLTGEEGAQQEDLVGRAVQRARAIIGAIGEADMRSEGEEERLKTLFSRLHRLAVLFKLKNLMDAMDEA
ncbi:hypothetical protein HDV00_006597 [Rhizophlyctis rosea]|nr:hypothetical protein HDV00_006597 [Rhizophlyctis rosea]